MQLTADLTSGDCPALASKRFSGCSLLLPRDGEAAPTRPGCVPGHQGHPGVREGTSEWLNPRSRVSVSSVPLLTVGAESELFSLTQLLGSWPGRPLQASGLRGWRQMSVSAGPCVLWVLPCGCQLLNHAPCASHCHHLHRHQPEAWSAGLPGGGGVLRDASMSCPVPRLSKVRDPWVGARSRIHSESFPSVGAARTLLRELGV